MKRNSYYGIVGNGETAALIDADLNMDWLCVPRFDGFPFFARALDPQKGGRLSLEIKGLSAKSQQYVGRTNVLRVELAGEGTQATVTDFMPWGKPVFIREILIENVSDAARTVPVTFTVTGTETAVHPIRVEKSDKYACLSDENGALWIEWCSRDGWEIPAHSSVTHRLVLGYGKTIEESQQAVNLHRNENLLDTLDFWEKWIASAKTPSVKDELYKEAYYRSLLTIKLVCYEKTGAMLAAPTASFPAVPGGGDNWDYRYCWLRDGYYTAWTLDQAGLHEESRRFYVFAFSLQEEDGSWRQPLYTIEGGNPIEFIVPDMTGPNGEKPIRFGNLAAEQLQLDNAGNIVHGFWMHYQYSGDKSVLERYYPQVIKAAEWVKQHWREKENGIWEIRERKDHWVHGKVMCYACIHTASLIAKELGDQEAAGNLQSEADRIKQDILENGWNPRREAYLQSYSEDAPVDISVLALEFYGLLDAADERMRKTVELIEQPLVRPRLESGEYTTASPYSGMDLGGLNMNGGIARYDYAHVPFYLPTIWLARHYLNAGNLKRVRQLVDVCIECSTDLLLMAEHFDVPTKVQWGNFPQAFSHEELARLILDLPEQL
ncbi:glycoside hydrolase family 15 protein [Effusibacillus consociatus]|uniref:Glycoside hydrolase family 15 protein n=1 Tax=Effusibacillus consociatus TaxID=1117041 RepID=A0ABV9Q3E2_9BACL